MSQCFAFSESDAGVKTFDVDSEAFKFLQGGRRHINVSECTTPESTYAVANDKKDPHFPDSAWNSRGNDVASGVYPESSNNPDNVAVPSHIPGSTHAIDNHTDNSNNLITVGPGDQKLSLSWKNPFDAPVGNTAKIHIFQSSDNVTFNELATKPSVAVAGSWQSQDITGLTNNQPYYFKLKLGFKRSDDSELLSDYSSNVTGTPKAIAPLNVSATQLERSDTDHPGQIKLDYQLRFDSTLTFEYFDASTNPPSWNTISDGAISGDKGLVNGNFDSPISHTTYLEMNTDFAEQYLFGSFKVRVNVDVAGQGQSNSESNLLTLDTKNPNQTSLTINATDEATANLTITASDSATSLPLEMKICNNQADEATCAYEAYSTTKNSWNIEGAITVFITFRDLYNNTTTISTAIREYPGSFAIKDGSNIIDGKYRLLLIWNDTANTDHYNIWRSTDGISYTQISEEVIKNAYVDINLDSQNIYFYKITSEDTSGNISLPAGPLSSIPGSAPDVTATPRVELSGWRQDKGVVATITWDTDQNADSNVAYSKGELNSGSDMTTKDGSSVQIAANPEMTLNHKIIIQNLEPSTTYYFKAFSKNEIQIAGYSAVLSFTTPERVPLLIEGMEISDITIDSAFTSWKTSKLATTRLEFSSSAISGDSTPANAVTLTDSNMNTNHSFKLTPLTPGTKYYVRAKNTDADGNLTTSDVYTFSSFSLPVISDLSVKEATFNTATITWTTNVDTDANVSYGLSETLSGTQGISDNNTAHSVTLVGLDANTKYYYRVISRDQFGNSATSETKSFVTSTDSEAPQIQNIKAEVASTGSGDTIKYQAIISWDTDEPATSQIEYSQGIGGDYSDRSDEILSLNSSHVVILPDLKPNAAYHFRIVSKDKVGNLAYSDDISLITPPKEKSLLQIVIKSLGDTFSWVGRLRDKWTHK